MGEPRAQLLLVVETPDADDELRQLHPASQDPSGPRNRWKVQP